MRATHQGECQICGSRQLLPGGVLSKHGYTVELGFFSGVCHGAGHLPFEQSKDQIAGVVAMVEKQITEFAAIIAQLEDVGSEVNGKPTAWLNVYHRVGYIWEEVEVVDFAGTVYGCGTLYSASAKRKAHSDDRRNVVDGNVVEKIEAYDKSWKLSSVRHWVHFLNCKRAASFRKQNESRRSWVSWQQQRMANWAPKALVARSEDRRMSKEAA